MRKITNHLILLLVVATMTFCTDNNEFDTIKERVVTELMKSPVDDEDVIHFLEIMKPDGSFQGINYDDLSRKAGFPHRYHTHHLVSLAKAYQTKASKFYRKADVKQAINKGLKFWVDNDFVGDNWHNNQISTPTNLVNLMLIIGDELPEDLVTKAQPIIGRASIDPNVPRPSGFYGARPSGDRVVVAGIEAKNLLFMGEKEKFDEVIKVIAGEVKFSTGERGMQHDYSFHHRTDRVNNTVSYGYSKYANVFGEWSSYVAGTKYAFSVESINRLVDYYLDGIYKQLVYGIYSDISVKNRSISHRQSSFEPRGTLEIERLLQSTEYRKMELEEIIQLRKGKTKPSKSFAKFFWQTEHYVHQRSNYYTTVRMFSSRNRNMEVPYNGPGKLTHHRADGTNYLQKTGNEYFNIWAVYDWQKVSGTTVLQKPEMPSPKEIQKDGLTDFVGAVCDDMYGAVAFDFISPHDKVGAKKSWFFFDDEYVCLGSGINSKSKFPVATTIDQVLLRGDVSIKKNNKIEKFENGNRELEGVNWIFHGGVGYILPGSSSIMLSNQKQDGRWSDITDQKNISDELVSEDVFLLWFNHGCHPQNASYEYIVVPDVSEKELNKTSADNRNIEILSNTPELQAVTHKGLGISQFAFYKAGVIEMERGKKVKTDGPGMLMMKEKNGKVSDITVSDPSRKLKRVSVTIPGKYNVKGENFVAVANESSASTKVTVELPQGVYLGKSVNIVL